MQGSAKRVGAEPPLRRRRKKHTSRQHKANRETQARKSKLNRRYKKSCSKGRNVPTRTKYREQMYRRFNCTKERMRFLCNPQTCRQAGNFQTCRKAGGNQPNLKSLHGRAMLAPTLGVRYRRSGQAPTLHRIMRDEWREQAPALHRFVQYGQPYK